MHFYHIIKLIILNWELSHIKNINQKCDEKHSGKIVMTAQWEKLESKMYLRNIDDERIRNIRR